MDYSTTIKRLKDRIIKELAAELELVAKNIEKARQDAIDAPGRMQARYDTTKQESSYLFGAFTSRSQEIEESIDTIKNLNLAGPAAAIDVGSIVFLDLGEGQKIFWILPIGGGKSIKDEELGEISVLNIDAPLFKVIHSKQSGDTAILNGKKIKIIKVI